MNVWILHPAPPQPVASALKAHGVLPLPLEAREDYTQYANRQALKKAMRANAPDLPPESVNREVDRIWHALFSMHREDFVAVPLQAEGTVLFAQITGRVRYAGTHFEIPVTWYERECAIRAFRRFGAFFAFRPHGELLEAKEEKLRIAIRDKLPLPGNRFARWKWIIVTVIALKLTLFALHLWQRETAGF